MSQRVRTLVRYSWRRGAPIAGVLLALLLTGCGQTIAPNQTLSGQSSTHYGPPPTAAPTYTAAPARPLQWQARSLPAPLTDAAFGISSANDGSAWACAPQGSSAHVWITRDGARHWQRVSDVTVSGPVDGCSVVADDVNPAVAVVQTFQHPHGCCALPDIPYPMAGTHDGGKTWTQVNGPYKAMSHLASYHGISYAVFHAPFADASPGSFAFAASHDGLRTWKLVDSALASDQSNPIDARAVQDFWLNPATGELLIHSRTSWIWSDMFEASSDGGATWHDLHAPIADVFVVRAPYTTGPWEICGLRTSSSSMHPDWPKPLICTLNSGKTWTNRDSIGAQDNSTFALANDGYALASDLAGLYRSAPGASRWDSLGGPPAPGSYWYEYQPGAGAGLIWALPQMSGTDTLVTQVYAAGYA